MEFPPTQAEDANQLEDASDGRKRTESTFGSASHSLNSFSTCAFSRSTSSVINADSDESRSEQDASYAPQNTARGSNDDVETEGFREQDGRRRQASRIVDNSVTTVMIRNLPCHILPDDLANALDDDGFGKSYDFLYMPSSLSTGKRHEYAFVNFHTAAEATEFTRTWHNTQRFGLRGRSRINVSVAVTQGLDANVEKWFEGKTSRIKSMKYWPFIQASRITNPVYRKLVADAFGNSDAAVAAASSPMARSSPQQPQPQEASWTGTPFYPWPWFDASSGSVAVTAEAPSAPSGYLFATAQSASHSLRAVPQGMEQEEASTCGPQNRSLDKRCKSKPLTEDTPVEILNLVPLGCAQPALLAANRFMAMVLDAKDSPSYVGKRQQADIGDVPAQEINIHIPGVEGSKVGRMSVCHKKTVRHQVPAPPFAPFARGV